MDLESFFLRETTLGVLLRNTAQKFSDHNAVIYTEKNIRQTWAELDAQVDALAKGFIGLGIQPGERVALWASNVPYWITVMFAAARIGAVLLNVNTSYRENELEYLLRHSRCENLVIADGFRDYDFTQTLLAIAPELQTQESSALSCAKFPHLKRIMALGEEVQPFIMPFSNVLSFAKKTTQEELHKRETAVTPDDVVNMQYTSGTTGFPKGVMLSHINIVNNGYWIGRIQNFSPNDTICLPVPLFHCFGCVLGVMAAVNHGTALAVMSNFSPGKALLVVEKERCTAMYGVPAMFLSMLEHRSFKNFDLSSLRTGIMAGSVCPEPLMRKVTESMHLHEITIVYGLTEASPGMTQTHADEEFERRVKTVGKSLPGIEVKVVDPTTMQEVPRGHEGEVICRGYNVMKGYYDMPEATKEAITPDGWLHTGDLGIMDKDGYLVISGRIKDMIIRAGENVYPREVEEFLSGMEEIFDVQVVGVQSRLYGEEVGAFIILKPGASITPQKIREFCRGKISWQKVPRYITFIDAFPMTASGKVQKYKLREEASRLFPDAMKDKSDSLLPEDTI